MQKWSSPWIMALVLIVLAGCQPAPVPSQSGTGADAMPAGEPSASGTIVVALSGEPIYLNPGITTGFDVHAVADSMFNGLVGLDANANPVPDLAQSWEIENNGQTYTFHLHPNVTWHDGEPFTAADVKFTFEEVLLQFHSRTKAGLENVLESIETPDDNTVVFNFSAPYAPLLQRLNVTEAPILPKHIYEGTDPQQADANLAPVGTGPFVFESFTPGQEVRLVRNEQYFKEGLPLLNEVVFRVIPDLQTQLAAMEQGEVDYVWRIPGPDIERYQSDPDIVLESVASGPGGGFCIMTLTFNLERPLFEDIRVRQAIAHAIDREQLLEQVQFGQGRVATAPISSAIAWANSQPETAYAFDPEIANELLDKAGYPRDDNGNRFSMDIIHFPTFDRWSEVMRENLAEIGVELTIRSMERAAMLEAVFTQRDFDTNLISYCNNTDPEIGVRRMYVSDNIGPIPFSNGAAYINPEIDELFAEAAATADLEDRATTYAEIQNILMEDLPYWWLVETDFTIGHRAACHDFQGWSGHFVETAWCE